jgi:hypothetical protein
VIGKSVVFESTPKEIVMDDRLFEGFSKKDIKAITYLAFKPDVKPSYKIVVQRFCEKLNRVLFKLKLSGENDKKAVEKTAGQILLDKSLIDGLSNDDIKNVSYMAGYEHSQNNENEMKRAKAEQISRSQQPL